MSVNFKGSIRRHLPISFISMKICQISLVSVHVEQQRLRDVSGREELALNLVIPTFYMVRLNLESHDCKPNILTTHTYMYLLRFFFLDLLEFEHANERDIDIKVAGTKTSREIHLSLEATLLLYCSIPKYINAHHVIYKHYGFGIIFHSSSLKPISSLLLVVVS